ncbi:diguanylate cyclase [Dyella sp. OK004]|uniref:diguanylate cyclase domain-containing protein n=1 Tax=Dyella sp. OK004 TaxID=1855292 RepID=UPI002101AFED|nr:diguanylate cyclase [Dyella sp. OK004]
MDDQPINIRALHQVFSEDHEVFMAMNGKDAVAFCERTPPDLVLLDIVMPGTSGLEVCRELKANPFTADIPVIFVTAQDNPEEESACWDAGAVDFITKPINPQTTRNRVRAHLTLKRQADVLRCLAWIDGLTSIPNKRQFDERMQQELRRCQRESIHLAVAVIDIDYFKAFNDTYGHLSGDDCLKNVAQVIHRCMQRAGDIAARTGGEEFTCILPGLDPGGAREIAERIQQAVSALDISHAHGIGNKVTVSVGVGSVVPDLEVSAESLIEKADQMLYAAKHAGRARVCVG